MADLIPLDSQIPLIDVGKDAKTRGYATYYFRERWNALQGRVQRVPYLAGDPISRAGQGASILATPLVLDTVPAGLYEVRWYARVTTPDGVSSSLQVTIGWTESGQALTVSGAAITGDSVTSIQSAIAPLLQVDQGGSITYATTYASNTPGQMKYRVTLTLSRVG